MRLAHLGIEYDNILSCVLDQNSVITKLRFVGMDEDGGDDDEPLARLVAGIVLSAGTLRNLLGDLTKLLDGFSSDSFPWRPVSSPRKTSPARWSPYRSAGLSGTDGP